MKYLIAIVACLAMLLHTGSGSAQTLPINSKGSKLEFNARMGGHKVRATFSDFTGTVNFSPRNLADAHFEFSVKTGSLHCETKSQADALKDVHFFDAGKYREITFKSESVTKDMPSSVVYQIKGKLTVKGVTKPVTLQLIATPSGNGYVFRGSFTLDRSGYLIGDHGELDDKIICFLELKSGTK